MPASHWNALLPIQVPATVLGKASEDGPRSSAPCLLSGKQCAMELVRRANNHTCGLLMVSSRRLLAASGFIDWSSHRIREEGLRNVHTNKKELTWDYGSSHKPVYRAHRLLPQACLEVSLFVLSYKSNQSSSYSPYLLAGDVHKADFSLAQFQPSHWGQISTEWRNKWKITLFLSSSHLSL